MNINTSLCKWDVLSFSTYKYVGTIAVLLIGLLVGSTQVNNKYFYKREKSKKNIDFFRYIMDPYCTSQEL